VSARSLRPVVLELHRDDLGRSIAKALANRSEHVIEGVCWLSIRIARNDGGV
jgi:hypothetical protein